MVEKMIKNGNKMKNDKQRIWMGSTNKRKNRSK